MLVLTYGSPASDTQRRVFAVLHGLGLGAQHRRGVAVIGDGFERFGPIAGVVCTPEAMAVLATREVGGAAGYLFAPLRGTWTIGGTPALVDGIAQNPVGPIDAALKHVVAAVRRGGLDPGYVQSIVAVDGPVTGVAQPETERGQGVIVARAAPEELIAAINIATANREPGLPSTWTTADLAGMLEVLGFDCSSLSNELLTHEGFPYSPYVLRPTSQDDIPFSRPEAPAPGATRELRSHAARPEPVPVSSVLAGSHAPGADHRPTGAIPAVTPAVAAGAVAPGVTEGPRALLNDPADEPERTRSPLRWLIPVVVLALVVAGVWFGWSALFGNGSGKDAGTPAAQSASAAATQPKDAVPQESGGYTFTPALVEAQTDCAAHSYGQIKEFFAQTACTSLTRGLFLGTVDGKQVIVTLAAVTMPTDDSAAALKAKTDTDGTGNVNDLLREGKAPAGLPGKEVLADSEYASSVNGKVVRIVQAAFVDGSAPTPKVDAAADAALQLKLS